MWAGRRGQPLQSTVFPPNARGAVCSDRSQVVRTQETPADRDSTRHPLSTRHARGRRSHKTCKKTAKAWLGTTLWLLERPRVRLVQRTGSLGLARGLHAEPMTRI